MVVFAGLFLSVVPALASHYPIEVVPFIEAAHKSKLEAQKIFDTEELLQALLTPKGRKLMARKTGIKSQVLFGYAQMCDLLRIRGVGPKMGKLLTLAGVATIARLRAEKPAPLLVKLSEANKKHGVSEIIPQEETLKDWIHQARNLDIIVE